MLGWEFPPLHSGGLGVATKNLALSLSRRGVPVCFALPNFVFTQIKQQNGHEQEFEVAGCDSELTFEMIRIKSSIASPYVTSEQYADEVRTHGGKDASGTLYGQNLMSEIERYAHEMDKLASERQFHLVHGHDWITFPAAVKVKQRQGTPFVAHVHATEMDRTGGNPNQEIYDRERQGMEQADRIIAVSNYTKQLLQKHYGINGDKIAVVHNGAESVHNRIQNDFDRFKERKTVLFLGRVALQKGPDWFVKIARRVLDKERNVQFLIAGTGGMMPDVLKEIAHSGIGNHVIPLGFLDEHGREEAFRNTDVYIMPSVSEPFGLSAIEAAQRGIPVIMSKQSGAREVLGHSLTADFWDVDKMAHFILAALHYRALHKTLSHKGRHEITHLSWDKQAEKMHGIYRDLHPAFHH